MTKKKLKILSQDPKPPSLPQDPKLLKSAPAQDPKPPAQDLPPGPGLNSVSSLEVDTVPLQLNKSDGKDETGFDAILARARAAADNETVPLEIKKGRGRPKKETIETDSFINIVSSGISLLLVSVSIPPEIHPTQGEIKTVSEHLVNILVRHFPITGGINADVVDIIAILGAVGSWYIRTAPFISGSKKSRPPKETPQDNKPDDLQGIESEETRKFLEGSQA